MKRATDGELVRIGDRVIELAPRQSIQQLFGFDRGIFDPAQVAVVGAQLLQRLGMRAARHDFDVTTVCLIEPARARIALPEYQMFSHLLIRRPEAGLRRQPQAARQAGRCDVRATRFELAHGIRDVRHGVDEQLDAQLRGEAGSEIELRPLRAVGAEVVGAGQITGDDAQLATAQNLLHDAGRLGTRAQQQHRDDGESDFQTRLPRGQSATGRNWTRNAGSGQCRRLATVRRVEPAPACPSSGTL